MNERNFKFAREAMLASDYTGSNAKVGAVAMYKGSIIGSACNSDKTSPLQRRYNVYRFKLTDDTQHKNHAETALIQKIRWKYGDSLQWDKVVIYIYREIKIPYGGSMKTVRAIARPCPSCFNMIKDMGIKTVCYTTDEGYCEEKIRGNV